MIAFHCVFLSYLLIDIVLATIIPSAPYTNNPISQELYDRLSTYAHIIDISYCISPISKIKYPFQCDNGCEMFNSTELVFQWSSNDLDLIMLDDTFVTSGYIALNHKWKTILLILRGTRSFKDTIVDINLDMIRLPSPRCLNCKIHKGFYKSYINTWNTISDSLNMQIIKYKDYKIKVMGHSLGGAIAVLLSLKISQIVEDNSIIKCITMGQPKIGNKFFSYYVEQVFDIDSTRLSFGDSRYLRITHKNDPVVQLPWSDDYLITDRYTHSSGEIYINEAGTQGPPQLENVVYCIGNSDMSCSAGMGLTRDNKEHLNYFRTMGKCGFSFH